MISLEQIKSVLKPIMLDDETIQTRANRTTTVSFFMDTFGDCELTYASLMQKEAVNEMGWAEIFEEWKSRGIIE